MSNTKITASFIFFQTPKRVEVHSIHTYVALYKFLPQEKDDLELQSVTFLCVLNVCVNEGWDDSEGSVRLAKT